MIGALLHIPLSQDEYDQLTLAELDEFRKVMRELTK